MKQFKQISRESSPAKRMSAYRDRMRAAGLRPVQIWVPDTRSTAFAEICRKQSLAIAKSDPAGDDIMHILHDVSDWSDI
jgi:hypothetical protein